MMRSLKVFAALVAVSGIVAATADGQPGTHSKLVPVAGGVGGGMIEVAPTAHDVAGPGTFDVQGTINVHGLAPSSDYKVLRWVDLIPDLICTGATALSLPGNPTLRTSAGGAGALHFEISRGAPFVDGVRFNVLWRVVDAGGHAVLQSDCLSVTVK
jgi:hypothetical protein